MKAFLAAASLACMALALPAADGTWSTGNSVADGDQDNVSIAVNRTGYVAIAWEDDRDTATPTDPIHSDVWLRLYKDGVSLYEKKISTGGTSNWSHQQPDVGLDDRGNAVLAWSEDGDGNGYFNIAVRVVNTAGTITGSLQANASSTGQQTEPAVSVDPDGRPNSASDVSFAVAWEDKPGTAPSLIRVAGFASASSKTFEVLASPAAGTHRKPDIATAAGGNTVVVWEDDRDGNGSYNVGLTRLTKAGGVAQAATTANADATGNQLKPGVAASFNGDFAVAWEDTRSGVSQVYVRGFSPAGAAVYIDHAVATAAVAQTLPSVGIDDQRNVVVAWNQATDVWSVGVNPDASGDLRRAAKQEAPDPTGSQAGLVTGVSAFGEVAFAYSDDADGNAFDQVRVGQGFNNSGW